MPNLGILFGLGFLLTFGAGEFGGVFSEGGGTGQSSHVLQPTQLFLVLDIHYRRVN